MDKITIGKLAAMVEEQVVSAPGAARQPRALVAAVVALLIAAALLAVGAAAVFPFEMDTVVSLSENRLVATHYGFYNTVVGVGILVGNLVTGAVVGAARAAGADRAVWIGLILIGVLATAALYSQDRAVTRSECRPPDRLPPRPPTPAESAPPRPRR